MAQDSFKCKAKQAEKLNIKKYINGLMCRKGSHYSPLYQSNWQGKGCVTCNSIRSKEKTRLKNEKLVIKLYTLESFKSVISAELLYCRHI